jgi:hypothetical protein
LFDKSEETRNVAQKAFHRWAPDLTDFLPTLFHEIESTNEIRRQTAAEILKRFDCHAAIIIPTLITTSENSQIRDVVSALTQ